MKRQPVKSGPSGCRRPFTGAANRIPRMAAGKDFMLLEKVNS